MEGRLKYSYLRVFALEVEVPPILVASGSAPSFRTRAEYLQETFSKKIEFEHWAKTFVYMPIGVDPVEEGAICSGRIGAQKTSNINAGPEEFFEPDTVTNWLASNFLLDTRDFNDGQKIAMQNRSDVGKPLSILSSLIKHINEANPDAGWELAVNSITEKTTFWQAVDEYSGQITRAEFKYATPNVLGLRSAINSTLKNYKDHENANQVSVTLENKTGGLKLDSQEVKDAVEYTSEGGGSTKLKVGVKTVYDSEEDEKAVTFEADDQLGLEVPDVRRGIIDRLFKR